MTPVTRGYYYAVAPDGTRCPHRHYELSRALLECWCVTTVYSAFRGLVRYVYADGNERPARRDELAELEAHHATT